MVWQRDDATGRAVERVGDHVRLAFAVREVARRRPPARSDVLWDAVGSSGDLALGEPEAFAFLGEVEGIDKCLGTGALGVQRPAVAAFQLGADVLPVVELGHESSLASCRMPVKLP